MWLKYFNAVNALALPPDLQVILHSRLLTKIMQGNNSLNNSRCPKIQDIGAKMLLYEFFSHIYNHKISDISHKQREQYHTNDACPNTTSANVILHNSSVNKKLILGYIVNTILSVFGKFFQQKYYLLSHSRIAVCLWAPQQCLVLNKSCKSMIKRPIYKESRLLNSWMNLNEF